MNLAYKFLGKTDFESYEDFCENLKIKVPENWTANVTFGGKDNHTLFITASKSVYTLQMKVKGVKK